MLAIGFRQLRYQIAILRAHFRIESQMVHAKASDKDLVERYLEYALELTMSEPHTVAKPDRIDAAILRGRPSSHRQRVGHINKQRVRLSAVAHVLADTQNHGDLPHAVEDAARAQRVADALIYAIGKRYHQIFFPRRHAANLDHIDDITRAGDRFFPVKRRLDLYVQAIGVDLLLAERDRHIQLLLVDIVERNLYLRELRYRQDVDEQFFCVFHAAGTNESHFELRHLTHDYTSDFTPASTLWRAEYNQRKQQVSE